MLRFQLLGPFEAWRDNQPIPATAWRTRQTLAVLKLLLTERGRGVTFERLGDLVWPESDPSAARASLRVAVRTIRSVLEPGVAGAGASHPATAPGGYRFDPAGCSIDVDGFLADGRAGAAAERRGDFLAGDPYLDCALEERERLRSACLDVLERLAALLSDDGAYAEAASHLERALSLDPLREELYAQLMKVHAAAGRRSHALATYERCRRVLERELGVEPSRETDRVRDEVETAAAGPATTAPVALDLAFVGREIELDAIAREWQAARSEPGHTVLIRGSIGVGKTRLVRRFAERGEPPPRTTWLTGHEAEVELSLAPALSLVGAWLETSASGGQVARLGAAASALAHLLPAVRTVWPGTPELTGRPDESQLLEALTLALLQIQGTGPALLVFDDLHWIDSGTAAWLGYTLRRLPAGVLTIATVRDAEPPAPWVQALLADRRREGRLTEITLEPLSSAEVTRLVPEAPPELAGRLHEATRGNPLFLVEILRELDRRSTSGSELPRRLIES
jgi:DNA-binding SARP family transcriptional activator